MLFIYWFALFLYWQYGGEEHLNAPPKELLLAQTVSLYKGNLHVLRTYLASRFIITEVSYPALKQILATISVNSWLILWSKMASALCKNGKTARTEEHVEMCAANGRKQMEFKGTANCKQILRTFWCLRCSLGLQVWAGHLIDCIHFSELHECHDIIEFRKILLGPGHSQMPSFWASWQKNFLGCIPWIPLVTWTHRAQTTWPLAMHFSVMTENSTTTTVQNSFENPGWGKTLWRRTESQQIQPMEGVWSWSSLDHGGGRPVLSTSVPTLLPCTVQKKRLLLWFLSMINLACSCDLWCVG